jgi:predicted Zn-dependent protease
MVPPKRQAAKKTIDERLDEAQQAIDHGDPDSARSIYNALLREPQLPHAPAMRLAEGLYRVRDFAGALRAFRGVGVIGPDEERYHYYYAVALFETRHYRDACRELDLALPFIEVTEDVAGYREKIYRATK